MISRSNRFHGRGSIQRLYKTAKSARTGSLALRFAPNERRQSYRLAVVVSRKISKSAVVRNRIRRRLYEQVRILSGNFTAPYDVVIVVYDSAIADMNVAKLTTEVRDLFKKAKLIHAGPAPHDIVEPKK